ncbi:hypothetical protein [Vibrio sp. 10N.261.55.A7]|uniref:hypothetical protein n=1 Tax=Vibrio sp. 10N.261.55.A7 TaxID=1880851 RepID=UPI000C83D5DB|nr:hypothetical protein [Vibrio sp. 10N.261.55.A7]PMJ90286.1 hypothetical protein BCU12_12390 [Vibrio sp. 10N.261.55.A7]
MTAVLPTNLERLAWYIEAEKKILMQQEVTTAEGEKLTLASLATVRSEIERLTRLVSQEATGGRRNMIRRNYLE